MVANCGEKIAKASRVTMVSVMHRDSLDVPLVLVLLPSSLVYEENGSLMNENGVFVAHHLSGGPDSGDVRSIQGKLRQEKIKQFVPLVEQIHPWLLCREETKASVPHSQFFLALSIRCHHPPNLIMCNSFQICVLLFLHLLLLPCSFFLKREQFLSE